MIQETVLNTTFTASKEDGEAPCYDPIVTVTPSYKKEITVSTDEEKATVETEDLAEGSTLTVTGTGTTYVLDSQGNWVATGGGIG